MLPAGLLGFAFQLDKSIRSIILLFHPLVAVCLFAGYAKLSAWISSPLAQIFLEDVSWECAYKKKKSLVHILFSNSVTSFSVALLLRIGLQRYLVCLTKVVTAKERSAQNGVRDEQGHFNEWMDLSFFVYYRYLSSLNCGAGFGFLFVFRRVHSKKKVVSLVAVWILTLSLWSSVPADELTQTLKAAVWNRKINFSIYLFQRCRLLR